MTSHAPRVRHWLSDVALPLWASTGVDDAQGGFVERLQLDGTPDHAAVKRVRVQARQIYVYSHAHVLGLAPDGASIAQYGYDFLMKHGCPDGIGAGFVHSLGRNGAIRDDRRDTYDHAFLLFAFSWLYRATGRTDVRAALHALGDVIWGGLRHASGSGFVVDSRTPDPLHQNPHMHLFEGVLAAYDATGDTVFMNRAHELHAVFRDCMFNPGIGVLREFYDRDWQPAAGEAGRIVEPGHHAEWIWLLKWYADRTATPLCDEAWQLHDFIEHHGRAQDGVLLADEVWTDGRIKKSSTRAWPQTEAIKAEIAIAEAKGIAVGQRADDLVAALFDTFLGRPVPGGWIDWVDTSGKPLVAAIPASTFYHVFLGLSEYLRARTLQ